MKNSIILIIALLGLSAALQAQTVNWRAFAPEQKNMVYLQGGWDYSLNVGLGYGRRFNIGLPVMANLDYSCPAGNRPFDDFKVRLGGQVEALHLGGFSATLKAYCPFRRYENSEVRLLGFGSEFSGVVGWYRPRWFFAGEFGFDKAIITHFKHSDLAREIYPGVQDGWYIPTGGNFFYGISGGFSFGRNDVSVKAGRLSSQSWDTAPTIPLFAQLAFTRRF